MSARPSRAKMCSWFAGALLNIQLQPSNPADIKRIGELRREAENQIRSLAFIASELGWHADASLDYAWELIQEYDADRKKATS